MEKELLNIRETANLLSVSTATIYNWVKTGKLQPSSQSGRRALLFERDLVQAIYENIEKEHSPLLKTRRNKLFVTGYAIPCDYVTYRPYVKLVKKIATWLPELSDKRLCLLEIALKWLQQRGIIKLKELYSRSMVLALQRGHLFIPGHLEPVLDELCDLDELALTAQDLECLMRLNALDIPWVEKQDFLGLVYMSISKINERKRAGSYYTPYRIAESLTGQVIDCLERSHPSKPLAHYRILDPCCGSGNFLLMMFGELRERLVADGWALEEAENHILSRMLYGNDLDKVASALAKINLILSLRSNPESLPLPLITNCNALKDGENSSQFDIIIGNPPWGSVIDPDERHFYQQHYRSAQGVCETFALFIEKSLSLLNPDGVLGFVLPEAFLNVSSHHPVRQIVLSATTIKAIALRGNDFKGIATPIITLVARKKIPSAESSFTITVDGHSYRQAQKDCLNTCYYTIAGQGPLDQQIIGQMRAIPSVSLKNHALFALGIVTGDNKKLVSPQPIENGEIVLKGSNIYRYHYVPASNYILFEPQKFQQVAPLDLYRAPEKLIYRFINKQLIVAYDDAQVLTLNSANILIPQFENLSVKYILAILNSRAIQFYYVKRYNSLKVLRQYLEDLPIPIPEDNLQQEIIECVDQILHCRHPQLMKEYYEAIDQMVMSLFGLSSAQQQWICKNCGEDRFFAGH